MKESPVDLLPVLSLGADALIGAFAPLLHEVPILEKGVRWLH